MIKTIVYKIRKKSILFFFAKILFLFSIIFFLDYFIGNILSYFYYKQESGLQYRTTYSIEKTKAEVLVFGSSRANHHYHPDVFEKKLNLSYYNVGRDGNFIFYHYAVLKSVLNRYSPKIVVLDFVRGEFNQSQDSYDRLASLLPYYRKHKEIRPIIELKSPFEKVKLISKTYPYNSLLLTLLIGNLDANKSRKQDFNGYVPLYRTCNNNVNNVISMNIEKELDSTKIKIYESFIQDCIKSKVKLYIVCSPYLVKTNKADPSIMLGKEIAKKYDVLFFDYSSDTTFTNNNDLFADIEHLNDNGARVFSEIVTTKIKTPIDK
jgi:hypothetical protein